MVTRVRFVAGDAGAWTIDEIRAVIGEPLPRAPRLARCEGDEPAPEGRWTLSGVRSHDRYVTRGEKTRLAASPELDRPTARRGVLIPIRKSAAWWALTQDERRAIFEEQSHHIAIGLEYIPAIARRLYHSRDLGEPWDFLTWFEYAPEDSAAFDALLARLRASEEWRHVEREVELRLSR